MTANQKFYGRTKEQQRKKAVKLLCAAESLIIEAMECLHSNKQALTLDGWETELRRAMREQDGTPEFLETGKLLAVSEKVRTILQASPKKAAA